MINQYGFPPIRYCKTQDNKNITKERSYAPQVIKTLNINKILTEEKKKPLVVIDDDNTQSNLEIVDKI